jgi:bacterioferritin
MKGNEKVIEILNSLLKDELTAINQYFVHYEMCENWGYERLKTAVRKRSVEEMKHAEKIIERILFLEGTPIVSALNQVNIGSSVEDQLRKDLAAEQNCVKEYNKGIRLSAELSDGGTRELLADILADEETHIDWLDAQLTGIKQMGVQNYLSGQLS